MDTQLSLRLPATLARKLAARARAEGIKRSELVRRALESFLESGTPPDPAVVRERLAPYLGSVRLARSTEEQDDLASRIRRHNWRE